MFADRNNMMPAASVPRALRCAGFVVDFAPASGPVDLEGFRRCVEAASATATTRAEVEAAFRALDPTETGYVSAAELRRILTDGDDALAPAEIQGLLDHFVPDDRGMICYNLFIERLYSE